MTPSHKRLVLFPFTLPAWSLLLACSAPLASEPLVQPPSSAAVVAEDGGADEQEHGEVVKVAGCADGLVKDDGTVETGYGFVPQAVDGIYLQEFSADESQGRTVDTVCVCWLKTRYEREIDFEIVFYEDAGGIPAAMPYAVVPGSARDVPNSVASAGTFSEVEISGVTLPPGKSYIGARWDPSQGKFLFICADKSAETAPVNVFFKEDMATGWTHVANSKDPMFRGHRAILVRARVTGDLSPAHR